MSVALSNHFGNVHCLNLPFYAMALAGGPSITYGGSGVGKTALIEACAAAAKRWFHCFLPTHHMPEELSGMPVVNRDEKYTEMYMLKWMNKLGQAFGWLHLDEYNTGSAMMRALLLSVTNEKRIGEFMLHPTTIITAAANPSEWAPNASELEPSVANRFFHWDWETPRLAFLEGIETGIFPTPVIPTCDSPELAHPLWGRRIRSFLESMPDWMETTKVPEGERSFPSLRTWRLAKLGLSALDAMSAAPEYYPKLLTGCVGTGASNAFFEHVRNLSLFNARGVVDGTVTVDYKAPIDRLCHLPSAMIFCLKSLLASGELVKEHVDNAFKCLLILGEQGQADLVKLPLAQLANVMPGYRAPDDLHTRFGSLLAQIMPRVA